MSKLDLGSTPPPPKPRVFNGNYKFNIYKGADVVYTGNSHFVAFMYRMIEKFDKNIYVGVL